jgi:hypothetical protein
LTRGLPARPRPIARILIALNIALLCRHRCGARTLCRPCHRHLRTVMPACGSRLRPSRMVHRNAATRTTPTIRNTPAVAGAPTPAAITATVRDIAAPCSIRGPQWRCGARPAPQSAQRPACKRRTCPRAIADLRARPWHTDCGCRA